MSQYTLSFSKITAANIPLVGGKGANLGVLTAAKINVPNGFCITTNAYKEFVAPAETAIYKASKKINMDDLESLRTQAQNIRDLLHKNPLPAEVIKQTIAAWQELGANNAYAVRSSATAEDLPSASFAGQQDTYLNIIGQDELLKAVKDCFISLFTDRAILYRMQNNFNHADVALSVVVQKMIFPQSAGIMFTADPISGNRNITSIDASFGLGEALVSGLVSADLYKVNKLTDKIITKEIAEKKIAIMPLKQGGVETVNLSPDQSHAQTLTDEQIVKLAQLGGRIEAHYGTPQDIEWAMADGELYITQSRPITSLFPVPKNGNPLSKDEKKVFFSFGHPQMMTEAMPPLALSMMKVMVPFATLKNGVENEYIYDAGGRIYMDIMPLLNHPKLRKIFPKMVGKAEELMSIALIDWVKNNPTISAPSPIKTTTLLKLALPFWADIFKKIWWQKHQNVPQKMTIHSNDYLENLYKTISSKPTYYQKLEFLGLESNKLLMSGVIWKPQLAASMVSMFLLNKIAKKHAEKTDLDALMRGLDGNVTTEMDLMVGDLADLAMASDELKTQILSDEKTNLKLQNCKQLKGGTEFLSTLDNFLNLYGARCAGEINIHNPRWKEDPTAILQMIMGIVKTSKIGEHRQHFTTLAAQNKIAAKNIIAATNNGIFGSLRSRIAKRLIYNIHELFPLREHHKFMIVKYMFAAKNILLDAAQKLEESKLINDANHIWFFSIPEIMTAFKQNQKLSDELIKARIADFEHYQKLTPPRLITEQGVILKAEYDTSHAPAGALVGSPVSAGIYEGIAKVITDPTTETLHKGEILVAPHTDPGWTPLFVNAAALICEVGGLMTHGSVIAREYGLPAVVGVPNATKIIKTGDRLRVHGDAGYVEILENAGSDT